MQHTYLSLKFISLSHYAVCNTSVLAVPLSLLLFKMSNLLGRSGACPHQSGHNTVIVSS